jgi:DNA repair exonuclease SbcCD ATPase subunit
MNIESLQKTITRYYVTKDQTKNEILRIESEIKALKHDQLVLEQVVTLFRHLIKREVYDHAERFSEIVEQGMRAIFHDQELGFRFDVEEKRGKVSIQCVTTSQEGHEGDPLKAFGGGVASIQSLILRVLVLKRKKLAPYLFLDESLAALSEEYVQQAALFLKEVCKRFEVNILLITHNKTFQEYADHVYRVVPKVEGEETYTEIEKVR